MDSSIPIDFSQIKILIGGHTPVLVNSNLGPTYDNYIRAAHVACLTQFKSIDYFLKKYMSEDPVEIKDAHTDLVNDIMEISSVANHDLRDKLQSLELVDGCLNCMASEFVFLRLGASFRSVYYHLRFGYYYETFAILRLILEQLSYSVGASNVISPTSHEDFPSASKAIVDLKKIWPAAGFLYGFLSKKCHIDSSEIHNIISISKNTASIVQNDSSFSIEACYYLLLILDCQECAFEYSFRKFIKEFSSIIKKSDGTYSLNPERKLLILYEKYHKLILKEISDKNFMKC